MHLPRELKLRSGLPSSFGGKGVLALAAEESGGGTAAQGHCFTADVRSVSRTVLWPIPPARSALCLVPCCPVTGQTPPWRCSALLPQHGRSPGHIPSLRHLPVRRCPVRTCSTRLLQLSISPQAAAAAESSAKPACKGTGVFPDPWLSSHPGFTSFSVAL